MFYSSWQLAALEEAGYMDTSESCIKRVAHYLENSPNDTIHKTEFRQACIRCNVDPDSFSQSDLDELQRKLNILT